MTTSQLRITRTMVLLGTLTSSVPLMAQEALPTTLDYADTFALEYVASPLFINDGKKVIYERRSNDIMHDRTHTTLWQVSVDSKEHTPFIAEDYNVRQATLSPDGKKLAFVSDKSGSSQIYVYYLKSGQTALLSNLEYGASSLTWSPDSHSIVFTMFTPAKPASLFTAMPAKPKGAKWAPSAKYIESTSYRADGAGYLPSGTSQIYQLPIEGGTPRQLTAGPYDNAGSLAFNQSGKVLYFSADHHENADLRPLGGDIMALDMASGDISQLTTTEGPEFDPLVSPDGRYLAFKHVNDRKLSYQIEDIYLRDLKSGKTTNLTSSLDRSIGSMQWDHDSDALVFSYLDQGQTYLARVSTDGDIDKLDITIGGQSLGRPYTSGDFTVADDESIAYTTSGTTAPADLAIASRRGKITQLTHLNDDVLGHLTIPEIEYVPVTSSVDGRTIDAWMLLPPNFDKTQTYPLILEIHGGPHAAYGPHFSMEIQLMAAKGYIVVWSNPRGSSSYGEDFANLIHHNYPSEDYNDLMDAVDTVIAKGNVDTNNLFITGGSGGGVLTAWSVGMTNRFAAAVVAKPVINWLSFALTADAYPYFSQYWMAQMPWTIPEKLWKRSPLSLVGNVTTPTMLLTGEADYRTPISESEQFYQALRLQGVDAAMVRIPGSGHGIAGKPSRLIQKVGHILAWFERYKTQEKGAPSKD